MKEMSAEFEKSIAEFIKSEGLFSSVDKILLAVSGGADSTALLYAMEALKAEGVLNAELVCAHINHRLRGAEADGDEDFVIAQARCLGLPIITKRIDVRGFARSNKLSIETAARQLRIESLLGIAKTNNCNCVATAHQKNDNAETVLQRLSRGTGFRGLGGIWPVRMFADDIQFVRPMLCVTRRKIVDYLEQRNLKWRVDRTNVDCTYRRNFIRHRLIPVLQTDCSGSIVEQLSQLAQSACKFYGLVCSGAEKTWPELVDFGDDKVKLDLEKFQVEPVPVKVELIRRSLVAVGSGEKDLAQHHYERILQLAKQKRSGKRLELPNGFIVGYEYGKLIFGREKVEQIKEKDKSKEIKLPGRTRFGRYLVEASILEAQMTGFEKFKAGKNSFVEWFDLDSVELPLVVRFRLTGDSFWPLGLGEEKKVGKFLTATKVPQRIRAETLIVADSEKIIWLWPIRISEQVKVTGETRKVLRLQITDARQTD